MHRRQPMLDPQLVDDDAGPVRVVPREPQRVFPQLNAISVMVALIFLFVLNYYFMNGYFTLLLYCILIAGALEAPGNTLRLVESDPWVRRFKVKFRFLFFVSLTLYLIIFLGLYFNRSCVCNWAA